MPGKRLLVVEDEPLIRFLIAECLADAGYEVLEAESGDQAVRILERLDRLDLVFTDIQMPSCADGNSVGTKAKQVFPDISVIYTSGRAESLKNKTGRHDAFVPKPYGPAKIMAVIVRLLAAREPT